MKPLIPMGVFDIVPSHQKVCELINHLHGRLSALEEKAAAPLLTLPATFTSAGRAMVCADNGTFVPNDLLYEVLAERSRQDAEHGGDHHDDTHTGLDWCHMIIRHAQRGEDAALTATEANTPALYAEARAAWRYQMIRVAAIALAAVESHDRLAQPEAA